MFARILLGLVVLFPLAMQSDMKITPLDVKVGLWETTVTSTMTGLPAMPSIPDSALAQMPPEQRAKIEEMIKERTGGKPTTTRSCLTKDKLEKTNPFENGPKMCTYTIVSSTSSKLEMKTECTQNDMKMTGDIVVEAVDSENVKGSVHMNSTGGKTASSGAMNISSTFTSKWLGAACGDVQ